MWVLTERASADDGIRRIVVDVEDGPEAHMNAKGSSLQRGDPSNVISERCIARCAERHLQRKNGGAAEIDRVGHEVTTANSEPCSSLEVGAEQQRNARNTLQRVRLRCDVER